MKVRKQEVLQVDCEEMPNFKQIRGMHIKTQERDSDQLAKYLKYKSRVWGNRIPTLPGAYKLAQPLLKTTKWYPLQF